MLSYVGREEDGKDVIAILERYKKGWSTKVRTLQIQKFLTGIEVAVGGYFNGEDFVMPVCINFEHKRLFAGEIGPSTGEMGTSMFWAGPNAVGGTRLAATSCKFRDLSSLVSPPLLL